MERATTELCAMVEYEQHQLQNVALASAVQLFECCPLQQFCKFRVVYLDVATYVLIKICLRTVQTQDVAFR